MGDKMECNDCKIKDRILNICKNEFQCFLNKSNVVGVGLGYKVKNGMLTNTKCIKVLVNKKLCNNEVLDIDIVPHYYKGIITDVVESGVIKAASLTKKIRPVVGGYSMGPATVIEEVGTVACLVTDGRNKYFLGNNHVFANGNNMEMNVPITQPCIYDGGNLPSDIVGTLAGFSKLQYKTLLHTPNNYVDCAIVQLTHPNIGISDIAFIGKPYGITHVQLGQNVQKVGRTTERTLGKVNILGATIETQFKHGRALFKDQIATTSMTNFGDSGSLLVDLLGFGAGLFFAQSESFSYYNPIQYVLDALNVNIVTE